MRASAITSPLKPLIWIGIAAAMAAAFFAANNVFHPRSAGAAAELEISGSCEPGIRPNEPALVYCTVTLTNNGTDTATDLSGSVFIAQGCQVPSRFSFIDRTLNETLVRTIPQGLSFDVPDIGPGVTATSTTRIATEDYTTGPTGGSVTISSSTQPGVSASVDLCWDVESDADAPPTNLTVTMSRAGSNDGMTEPAPPPTAPTIDGDQPMPIPPPPTSDGAQFEIVVTNTSNETITGVSLLDMPTGDAVYSDSDPAASLDEFDRPVWDAGDLAPGEEFRALVSFGTAPGADCGYADGVAVVTATGPDGQTQDYVAFSDAGVSIGFCSPYPDNYCLHYAPGEQQAAAAPCEDTVCWSTGPDGYAYSVNGCEAGSYCWYTPPGDGSAIIQPCGQDVCWFSFGYDYIDTIAPNDYYSQVPCDQQFCSVTAPDGQEYRGDCAQPVCWGQEPVTGAWQEIYGCGQLEGADQCWFTSPDATWSLRGDCSQEFCWLPFQYDSSGPTYQPIPCTGYSFCNFNAPDESTSTTGDCASPPCWSQAPGSADWQQVYDCGSSTDWCWYTAASSPELAVLDVCGQTVEFAVNTPDGGSLSSPWQARLYDSTGDWCWPVPPGDGPFEAFVTYCDDVANIYWFQQDDGSWFYSYGPNPCGLRPPDGAPIPLPAAGASGDVVIPEPCPTSDVGEGVPGDMIPVVTETAESTTADIVEGEAKPIEPVSSSSVTPVEIVPGEVRHLDTLPSVAVEPADLVPSVRVEPITADFPVDLIIQPVGPIDGGPLSPAPEDDGSSRSDIVPPPNGQPYLNPGDNGQESLPNTITSLPNSGSETSSSGGLPAWPMAVLTIVGVLGVGAAIRSFRLKG